MLINIFCNRINLCCKLLDAFFYYVSGFPLEKKYRRLFWWKPVGRARPQAEVCFNRPGGDPESSGVFVALLCNVEQVLL